MALWKLRGKATIRRLGHDALRVPSAGRCRLAWNLRDLLGGSENRFRRVTFSEITPAAVRAPFQSPRRIDYDLVHARQARRLLDRVVRFTVSPLLSGQLRAGLSAGRVQSAAQRFWPRATRRFESSARRSSSASTCCWPSTGADPVRATVVDADGGVVGVADRGEADAGRGPGVGRGDAGRGGREGHASQRPKPPFTTSTLQQAASSLLKLSVSDTMAIAKKLYEAGKVTCMRSDGVMVAPEAQEAVRRWLTAAFGEGVVLAQPPRYESKEGPRRRTRRSGRPIRRRVRRASTPSMRRSTT